MKESVIAIPMLLAGIGLGIVISNFIQVKKEVTVEITGDTVTFESNKNQDGDTYSIIINKDTVGRGVIVDGRWVNP